MAVDPNRINLDESQRRRLAELSEQTGKPWSQLLDDALHKIVLENRCEGSRRRKLLGDVTSGAGEPTKADLDELAEEATEHARHGSETAGQSEESLYDVLSRSGFIGCVKDAPPDLSTKPKYMEGFGEDGREEDSD